MGITKKELGKITLITIFLLFSGFLLYKEEYWTFLGIFVLIVVVAKIEDVVQITLNTKDGLDVKFEKVIEEKIKENIIENEEEPTKEKIKDFERVEDKALEYIHKKIGGELKRKIHFAMAETIISPTINPKITGASVFTPDATIKKGEDLFFIEVKNLTGNKTAQEISHSGSMMLKFYLDKFKPYAQGTNLKGVLVLATPLNITLKDLNIPHTENMEIELFKYER
jgi:hypothetical protein